MTMNFELLEDAVTQLLIDNAAGKFQVAQGQEQALSAEEVQGSSKVIQVYWSEGDFPMNASGLSGPYQHDISLTLEFTVSMITSGDLSVLENGASTPAQLMAASAALENGNKRVHLEMRSFFRDVFQILMDGANIDPVAGESVGSRWIENFKKDNILRRGQFAMLKGKAFYTCRMDEYVVGITGVGLDIVEVEIEHDGEAVAKAGVRNDPTP